MTIASTNITNHLLGLIQNLNTTNNRGETKTNSSKADSFESVFKEYASTSHQPTSREETEAPEVSPDYYKNKSDSRDTTREKNEIDKNYSEEKITQSKDNTRQTSKEDSSPQLKGQNNTEKTADQKKNKGTESSKDNDTAGKDKTKKTEVSENDKTKTENTEKNEKVTENNQNASSTENGKNQEDTALITDAQTAQSLKELLQQILDLLQSYTAENGKIEITDSKELSSKLENLFQNSQFSEFWNKFKTLTGSASDSTKGQDKLTLMLEQMLTGNTSQKNTTETADVYKEIEDIVSLLKNNKDTLKNIFPSQNSAMEENSASKDFLKSIENLSNQIESQSLGEDLPAADLTKEALKINQKIQASDTSPAEIDTDSRETVSTEKTSAPLTKGLILSNPSEEGEKSSDIKTKKDTQQPLFSNAVQEKTETKPILDQMVQKIATTENSQPEAEAAVQNINKSMTDLAKTGTSENTQKIPEATSEIKTTPAETTQQNSQQTKMDLAQTPLSDKTAETKNTNPEIKSETKFTQYLSKAFASENEIIDKIISQAKLRMNNGEKELTLQLSPPELGHVKIQLNESAGIVSGKIQVDSDAIKEIVQSNLQQLKASLNETIKIDKLDVEVRENAGDQSLLQSFKNQDSRDNSGFKDREKAYSETYYEDDPQGSFGLDTPSPKGLTQRENGLLSVDLFL